MPAPWPWALHPLAQAPINFVASTVARHNRTADGLLDRLSALPPRDLVAQRDGRQAVALQGGRAIPPVTPLAQAVNPRISCAVSSGTSSCGQWPTPSSST